MVLLAISACTPATTDPVDTGNSDDENMAVLIRKGAKTDYIVIHADDVSDSVAGSAKGIAYQLSQKFSVDIICYAEDVEWGCPNSSKHEILVGNTTREESKEAAKLLKGKANEYIIKLFDNGKIAIVASNDQSLKDGISYFINTFINSNDSSELKMEKGYEYYKDMGTVSVWKLSTPEYVGGTTSKSTYQIGYNGSFDASSVSGKMQCVSGTNATEFNAFIDTLKANQYTVTGENTIGNNVYYQLCKGSSVFYAYYLDNFKEARVIEDYVSNTESDFEYTYTAKEGETAAIYQYGMMYDPDGTGGTITPDKPYENNGATLIIRLSDNSLVIVDGGRPNQASDAATEGFMNFLYEITGVDKNSDEKIRVAAVFFSHGDGDHLNFMYSILRKDVYTNRLDIQRVMHNFPGRGYDSYFPIMGSLLYEKYPSIKFMKLHTGQKIQLADATFEIAYTHEDMVDASTGSLAIPGDGNLFSTIFKLTLNGKTFFAMGDWGVGKGSENNYIKQYNAIESKLLGMYKTADGSYPFLECDILQVAHHAINDNNANVHAAVKADYAFFSQADVAYNQLFHPCYRNIVDQLEAAGMERQHMYFAGRQTNWLTIAQDGTITHGHKKIEGVDEARYWYVDKNKNIIYLDVATGTYNVKDHGVPVADTDGALVEALEAAGFEDVTAVEMPGYWELLDSSTGIDGQPLTPFWPENNT